MNTAPSLACNMSVFTPVQRESHLLMTTQLFQAVQTVQEAENGYEFTFPNESEFISKIAAFISNERLCCPFLEFTLGISNCEPVSLALTGPVGTKEFLHVEFAEAFR